MGNQRESELNAFRHFLSVSGLPVEADSVELREPPEPDIRCQLTAGEVVAFELVEMSNPANARFAASAHDIHRSIMAAYSALPPSVRHAFDARFLHVPLAFTFRATASRWAIQRELPRLLTELVSIAASDDGYSAFSASVAKVVSVVRERGRPNDLEGVNFNLGGSFDPSIPLDGLAAKLRKRYSTPHPVELLAHFGGWAWGNGSDYQELIQDLIESKGLGQFRRIWVHDWSGIGLVLPDDPRGAA